ncbi:MAG TPA: hypothetical protein VK900_10170 [Anaerolineales bacterium]|nr:hypothetical protein [Anaerolineales bacterium]
MQPDPAYELFSAYVMQTEQLEVKSGKGGRSYYKQGVFVCHFNARPQKGRDDLGFADFRYNGLRPFLDVEQTIAAIQKEARPEVQIKSHKLWCSLHFPLSELEHVAALFVRHVISKINL